MEIPFGYCHCGCGERAPIARKTSGAPGYIKGKPARFVSGHSARVQYPSPMDRYVKSVVIPDDDEGCWLWTGSHRGPMKYATFTFDGKTVTVSRFILSQIEPMPFARALACHTCDNAGCVNPLHLYWGTHQDNSDDAVARCRLNGLRGLTNGNSKWPDDVVAFIKASDLSYGELVKATGVPKGTVAGIKTGRLRAKEATL